MKLFLYLCICMMLSISVAAKEAGTKKSNVENSSMLGMSVTGNSESPRSLTIVPWREPIKNGKLPMIHSVWQPELGLLEPESYRRDIKMFLEQRKLKNNKKQPSIK